MFFAYLTSVCIILGFLWLFWLKVVKPALEAHGVDCDGPEVEPEPEPTEYEKRRNDMAEDLNKTRRSADAAEEILEMSDEKSDLDATIKGVEDELKK